MWAERWISLHPRLKGFRMEISASEVALSQSSHSSHDLSTNWESVFLLRIYWDVPQSVRFVRFVRFWMVQARGSNNGNMMRSSEIPEAEILVYWDVAAARQRQRPSAWSYCSPEPSHLNWPLSQLLIEVARVNADGGSSVYRIYAFGYHPALLAIPDAGDAHCFCLQLLETHCCLIHAISWPVQWTLYSNAPT